MSLAFPLSVSRRGWLRSFGLISAGFATGAFPRRSAGAGHSVFQSGSSAKGIINLSLNESPFGPSPKAIEAVRQGASELFRYPGGEAAAAVRQIAVFEGVPENQILLGDVLEPLGLYLGLQGAGGEIIYSSPGYTALVDAAKPVGGVPVPVPLNDRLENDLDALAARITGRTRALFLVNPHNPSGTVTAGGVLRDFIRDVSRRTLVVVDEAYLEYTEDFAGSTAAELVRAGANVAVFRTFSKIHGQASLPFGYAVAPAALAEALRTRGVGGSHSVGRLSLLAATANLSDPSHARKVRHLVAEERRQWHDWLDSAHVRRSEARGNFVFFEAGRPQIKVATALRQRGVEIGRAFPPLDGWTRITIGLPGDNLAARAVIKDVLAGRDVTGRD